MEVYCSGLEKVSWAVGCLVLQISGSHGLKLANEEWFSHKLFTVSDVSSLNMSTSWHASFHVFSRTISVKSSVMKWFETFSDWFELWTVWSHTSGIHGIWVEVWCRFLRRQIQRNCEWYYIIELPAFKDEFSYFRIWAWANLAWRTLGCYHFSRGL